MGTEWRKEETRESLSAQGAGRPMSGNYMFTGFLAR